MDDIFSDIKIESFIPSYPSLEDEQFSYEIARRKEFSDNKMGRIEEVIKGELLTQQNLVSRFLAGYTEYTSLYLNDAPGTGKTLTAISVEELLKVVDENHQCLFIVPNDILADNVRQEIMRHFPEEYEVKYTRKELEAGVNISKDAMKRRINKTVARFFEIVNMETFLSDIDKYSEEKKKSLYSNRFIVLDEAHKLKPQSGTKDSNYDKMHRFLHLVENCKIMPMSATIIWDRSYEWASQMNFVLPLDSQLPTGNKFLKEYFNDGILIPEKEDELVQIVKGRISVLRPMITNARRNTQGQVKPYTKYTKIYTDKMSKFQTKIAKEAKEIVEKVEITQKGKIIQKDIKGGSIYNYAIHSSNFVFPDGTYGQKGFEKHCVRKVQKRRIVKGKEEKYTIDEYKLDKETRDAVIDDLGKLSSKFDSIIKDILDHPDECFFVYCEQVTGSGAILFGLVLEAKTKFTQAKTKISSSTHQPAKRFAILTNKTTDSNMITNIKEGFNEPANKYGKYIQGIIGSEVIQLGVSFNFIRRFHSLSVSWNISGLDQALYRILRLLAYILFDEHEREVYIFFHAAVYNEDFNKRDLPIDIYIYRTAEDKEYENAQLYRISKIADPFCALSYKRNVLPEDEEGSRDCNYRECNYECLGFEPTSKEGPVWDYDVENSDIIHDNYNLFYSEKEINEIVKKIIELFHNHFSLEVYTMFTLLDIESTELMFQALNYIINNKIIIRNRYGFISYLKEQSDIYFLDKNVSACPSYASCEYVINPLIVEKTLLEDLVDIDTFKKDKDLIKTFCKNHKEEDFNNLSYKTQIVLTENVYEMIKNKTKPKDLKKLATVNEIIRIMDSNIYKFEDENVHTMYAREFTGLSYTVSSQNITSKNKIRILSMNEDGIYRWKFIGENKEQEYLDKIKKTGKKKEKIGFENNPYGIYGTISSKDKKFRLVIKVEKGQARKTGKVCSSFELKEIISIFLLINYFGEQIGGDPSLDKDKIIDKLRKSKVVNKTREELNEFDEEDLRKILSLVGKQQTDLCEILQKWFQDNGLLFEQ